eukprot:scaffold44_cov210-Pinguiococcus_pyrenoidosus.AAC.1
MRETRISGVGCPLEPLEQARSATSSSSVREERVVGMVVAVKVPVASFCPACLCVPQQLLGRFEKKPIRMRRTARSASWLSATANP